MKWLKLIALLAQQLSDVMVCPINVKSIREIINELEIQGNFNDAQAREHKSSFLPENLDMDRQIKRLKRNSSKEEWHLNGIGMASALTFKF